MVAIFTSLLLFQGGTSLVKSADQLELQLEGMLIPLSIKELSNWARSKNYPDSELTSWLNLLERDSREGFLQLLNAPLVKELSMSRQIIRSWAGRQLVDEISDLIQVDNDKTGRKVISTLEQLLQKQPQVSTLDLLEALPAGKIKLDLDAFLEVAIRWRAQLERQRKLSNALAAIAKNSYIENDPSEIKTLGNQLPKNINLNVSHRYMPINIDLWRPTRDSKRRNNLIIFMPGLGGSKSHFEWLAKTLTVEGWPVVMLEHPGSDSKAVKALLEGKMPAPGAEVLPGRIADLRAVLKAHKKGNLFYQENSVVLIGHSLGALTAFLAAGATPKPGLEKRCNKSLEVLSLINPSSLLQCQLSDVQIRKASPISKLEAIIGLNSFGSLLWPSKDDAQIRVPLLLSGGTLDLITPPQTEQLGLFLATPPNKASRVVLIKGASHFSVVRIENTQKSKDSPDLFKLSKELVGNKPRLVQKALAKEIINFLSQVEDKKVFNTSHKKLNDLRIHNLNRKSVEGLLTSQ